MNTYEREYFVSRVRSGIFHLKIDGQYIKILTPTIEDEYFANQVFMDVYNSSIDEGILTEQETLEWLRKKRLWTEEKENKIEGIKKDIEKLKVEIFNARTKEKLRETIRHYIRAAEKALNKMYSEKNDLLNKTCESIALQEKSLALFSKCCFNGNEILDINTINLPELYYQYSMTQLNESQCRELSRTDPWRLVWTTKKYAKMFANKKDRQLSNDQKSLIIWSSMYDNVHESIDCPSEDVINDDDMLDGWFIIQRKKAQSEKSKSELEQRTNNKKIANSDEIMIIAGSKKESEIIHNMNSVDGEMIRKQRINTVLQKNGATDLDFQDRKIEIGNKQRDMYVGQNRRR